MSIYIYYSHDLLDEFGKDYKFPVTFGHGIVFDYRQFGKQPPVKLRTIMANTVTPEVSLDLTSWAGTSFGAVHWYAKMRLPHPSYVFASNGKRWKSQVCGGEGNYDLPFGSLRVDFEVTIPASKAHVKQQKDMLRQTGDSLIYGKLKLHDWTHGFFTEEDAKAGALKFFKEHFAPGWVLVNYSWGENEERVIAKAV